MKGFMKSAMKAGAALASGIYLVVLTKLILFKHLAFSDIVAHFTFRFEGGPYWRTHNFIPFKTIAEYLFLNQHVSHTVRLQNVIGNIIAFVPFGLLVPLCSSKIRSFKTVAIATFCLSLTYELLQLVFRFGSFDVDDLLLNTLGGLIGFVPVKLASMYVKRGRKDQKAEQAL